MVVWNLTIHNFNLTRKIVKILTLKNNGDFCELEAVWDVKLSGMMGMFTGMIKKHIKSGTEQALQAIKKEVED